MIKKILTVLSAAMLLTGICAEAEQVNIAVEETSAGLSVSVTAAENGGMYIIGAMHSDSGQLEGVAVEHIDNAVSGEIYAVKLDGIYGGSSIYVWDDNQKPLCDKFDYDGTEPTPGPEETSEPTETPEPAETPDPDATPTPEPTGDGIIHLKGAEIDASGVTGAEVDGTIVTITAVGDYIIEGTLDDGQIVVSDSLGKKDAVNITLQGVNVTCSDSAPFNGGGGKIGITLADGTTNTFTDTSKYTNYTTSKDPKGCFYSRRDLDIGGEGTLVVNGNVKNGLVCGADLKIKKKASLEVTAVNNAIKGDNGVEFTDKTKTVKIISGGDGIKSDAIDTDIVSTGAIEADKGYVLIEGGTFTINADGDGIQADNYCTITGGNIAINSGTEGIKANEVNLPVLEDDAVVEGEYINGIITISGGTVDITAGEDGIKATELVEISGDANVTVDANAAGGYDGIQAGETTDTVDGSTVTTTVDVWGTVKIDGATVNINGASDDGIVAKGTFIMTEGSTLTGKAACDFIKAYELVDISGGTLNITSGQDGIQSGKALTEVTSGTTVTKSNYTTGNVNITGGKINITAGGGSNATLGSDAESCKGIKANTDLNISGGDITIDSADDCIHSNWDVTITGGTGNSGCIMELATGDDGIHADRILTLGTEGGGDDDFTINISTSYEGFEGSVIYILSGTQRLYATDDGINSAGDYNPDEIAALSAGIQVIAGPGGMGGNQPRTNPGGGTGDWGPGGGESDAPYGLLVIKGGRTYVVADGDGLDSNGKGEMSGGLVIVNAPTTNDNDVIDTDNGFSITGGTLIAVGAMNMGSDPSVSGQGYAKVSSSSGGMGGNRPGSSGSTSSGGSKGNVVTITTTGDSIIFVPEINWSYMYVTSPEMTNTSGTGSSGGSYSITAGSASSYTDGVFGRIVSNKFYGLVSN